MNARIPTGILALQANQTNAQPGTDMSVINLAARQRMLSQRLTLQIVLAAQGIQGQLEAAEKTLALFRESESVLTETARQAKGPAGDTLKNVYFGQGQVEHTVSTFIRQADEALSQARSPRTGANQALQRLVDQVDGVLQALNEATSAFDRIGSAKEASIMRELKEIVGNIQSVAREAKVVSFNAQVIAARAGTVGREFAVVANTLANISQQVDTLARKGMTLTTA